MHPRERTAAVGSGALPLDGIVGVMRLLTANASLVLQRDAINANPASIWLHGPYRWQDL